MSMQENLAAVIRAMMEKKRMSLSAFADELGISRAALYDYIRGKGNPSAGTIELISERLGVSPAVLMTGMPEPDQQEIALLLLDTIQNVAELDGEKRTHFAKLFLEMVKLWNEE